MKTLILLIAGLAALGAVVPAAAQVTNEALANEIIAARKANAAMMHQYSWSSRLELLDNGQVKDTRIDLVSYGPNNQLQRTLVNDEHAPLPHGFLRKRIAEKEREKVHNYLSGLRAMLDQYTLPSAGKVIDFVSQAEIKSPDANGLMQITGGSVVVPGDSFTLWVDAKHRQTRKVQVTTFFEADMVTLSASFKTLSSGLTHLQYGEVDVPDKGLQLMVHNFDYNRNN
jgi:hypothetical protein